jgi:outer membrane receptor protein involved in Fe transport
MNVSVDIPISDTLFTKWTAAIQDQGGWVKSLTNGQMYGGLKNEVYRGDLLWKPKEGLSVRLTASQDQLVGTPAMEERFTNLQTVGSKGANVQNIVAYNIAMLNPAYGPYTYNTTGTPWLSRFNNGNQWTAQANSYGYPGGRLGKWENDETEPLNSEQEDTKQYTATINWEVTPHLTFTNLAAYLRQDSYHFDNDPAAPVYQWNQLRLYRYDYWSEEAHLQGDLFDNKINFLAGVYYQYTRQRSRTYSWPYAEFFTPANSDPVLEGGTAGLPVLDQNLINFIHNWGVANANTALGLTRDPMTGKTYAQDMAAWKPNFSPAGQQPTSPTDYTDMISDNRNNDYSVFLNATWHPTTKIDLQGGIRAAWNNGTNDFDMPVGAYRTYLLPMLGGGTGYGPGSLYGYSSVAKSQNPYPGGVTWTPMATATYHFTDDVNSFFRFAEGYTTGSSSFNAVLNQNVVLQPEVVKDYELGVRSDWFHHRLRANLTGYFMMWDGKQISTSIAVGNTFAVVTTSGGRSRAMGFEGEIQAVPIRGLTLELSVANLDTRWLNSGTQNIPPDTLWALAPKWTVHLAGQYEFDLPNQAEMTLRADYGYQSEYQRDSDPGRQLLTPEPGYGLLNARIQYTAKGGRWNLQLYGTNLTDKAYIDAGTGSVYLFGVDAAYLGQRRMVGARLNFNY